MWTMQPSRSRLLVVDLQVKLMPAIDGAETVVANARRLIEAAQLINVPRIFTEQNPKRLGETVPGLLASGDVSLHKMTFDATLAPDFLRQATKDRDIIVAGCEAHVCVLQTVLGLVGRGRKVWAVRDAIGARRSESKETALARMARHGVEIVTTEMVVFEWLRSAEHPEFRRALQIVK